MTPAAELAAICMACRDDECAGCILSGSEEETMSACGGCGGKGYVIIGSLASGEDDHEATCRKCSGTGAAPCVGCGDPSLVESPYCSEACQAADHAGPALVGTEDRAEG